MLTVVTLLSSGIKLIRNCYFNCPRAPFDAYDRLQCLYSTERKSFVLTLCLLRINIKQSCITGLIIEGQRCAVVIPLIAIILQCAIRLQDRMQSNALK